MTKSNLQLNIPEEKRVQVLDSTKDLQRTKEWFLERNEDVTASISKKLMACGKVGGKLSWNEKMKVYNFSSGFLSLVYEKAMQQKTKRYIDSGKGVYEMRYGAAVEPLILKAAKKLKFIKKLLKKGYTIELVGYKSFPDIPNAGASTDAVIRNPKGKVVYVLELKACVGWGTHFQRTFDNMNDKDIDFWQTQSQIIAWNVKKCIYIVAEPPTDITKYIFAEDINDLWKDWKKECKVTLQKVKASKVHQEALKERIIVLNTIVKKYLKNPKLDLRELTYKTIDEFKQNIK